MSHLWQDTLTWALSSIGLEEQAGSPSQRPCSERGSSWAFTDTAEADEACAAQSEEATASADFLLKVFGTSSCIGSDHDSSAACAASPAVVLPRVSVSKAGPAARDTSPADGTRKPQANHFVAESDVGSDSIISVAAGYSDSEVTLPRQNDFPELFPHSSECFDKPVSILRDWQQERHNSFSFPRAAPGSKNFADVIAHLKSEARRCDNAVLLAIAQARCTTVCASCEVCLQKRGRDLEILI